MFTLLAMGVLACDSASGVDSDQTEATRSVPTAGTVGGETTSGGSLDGRYASQEPAPTAGPTGAVASTFSEAASGGSDAAGAQATLALPDATVADSGSSEGMTQAPNCLPFSSQWPTALELANTTSYETKVNDGSCRTESSRVPGCVTSISTRSVDERGIEVSLTDSDADGTFDERGEAYFDYENNVLIQYVTTLDGEPTTTALQYFDAEGRVVRAEHGPYEGPPAAVTVYEYDENGNLLSQLRLGSDGTPDASYTFEYDEKGAPKSASYIATGVDDRFLTFACDEQGRVVHQEHFFGDSKTPDQVVDTVYDDVLHTQTATYSTPNTVSSVVVTTLDAEGRTLRRDSKDADGIRRELLENVFDAAGNLRAVTLI